jgi:hydrogenase nickel incorporation protein HypA/HybF
MHELSLMRQVVALVETALAGAPGARPTMVRLRVAAFSHLHEHDPEALSSAFALAARGTRAQAAALEVIAVPVAAACRSCGRRWELGPGDLERVVAGCEACGTGPLAVEPASEVVLHELVLEERRGGAGPSTRSRPGRRPSADGAARAR